MAVPLMRNAFAENRPDLFVVLSKRSENVLFRFFLHKTTNRYNFRKIFAVLSVILRLQKRGTEFLGNDHQHHPHPHHHHHHHHCHRHHHHLYSSSSIHHLQSSSSTSPPSSSSSSFSFSLSQSLLSPYYPKRRNNLFSSREFRNVGSSGLVIPFKS